MNDPYREVTVRLRAGVQAKLREGVEPSLPPYEQLLLFGWYERELARLEAQVTLLGASVDGNFAARLEHERASLAAVTAMDEALRRPATPLDGQG